MAERMIGLAIDELFQSSDDPGIAAFLDAFAQAIHNGDGRKTAVFAQLGIDIDFPARLLLGVPKTTFTREHRLLGEAFCSLHFGRPFGVSNPKLWTTRPRWTPTNPRRVEAPLAECTLDVDWMLGLGVTRLLWDRYILKSEGALNRAEHGALPPGTAVRYLLLLSVFGFQEPIQFFTADRRR